METPQLINYHRTRDFSAKMSVTFEFVRLNFRALSKSILLIAGPPVLLASLLMGSFFKDIFSASFSAGRGIDPEIFQNLFMSPTFWLQVLLMMVFLMLSTVATLATINSYIILYEEKKTSNVEVADVWNRVRDTFWMYLGTAFQYVILTILAYIVLAIPIGLLGIVSPVLVFFGVMAFICAITYVFIGSSMIFIIRAYERTGFMQALGRSFRLIQGKWWSTFGLITVLYLIIVVVSYVFIIPWSIVNGISTLHDVGTEGFEGSGTGYEVLSMVLLTLYYLAQMIMYALPSIGVAFQYFNLVERKEAKGLLSQIDAIGQAPAPAPAQDEHY